MDPLVCHPTVVESILFFENDPMDPEYTEARSKLVEDQFGVKF